MKVTEKWQTCKIALMEDFFAINFWPELFILSCRLMAWVSCNKKKEKLRWRKIIIIIIIIIIVDFAIPVIDQLVLIDYDGQRKKEEDWKYKKAKWKINTWILPESWKKLKTTVIQIVVGAPGISPKGLEKRPGKLEIRGRIKTIQITELLRLAKILRRLTVT